MIKHLRLLSSVFAAVLITRPAQADRPDNIFHVKLSGAAAALARLNAGSSIGPTTDFRLGVFVPGLGRVRLKFDRERTYSVTPTFTHDEKQLPDAQPQRLFRGSVTHRGGSTAAAASFFNANGRLELHLGFPASPLRHRPQRYYRLASVGSDTRVSRSPRNSSGLSGHASSGTNAPDCRGCGAEPSKKSGEPSVSAIRARAESRCRRRVV